MVHACPLCRPRPPRPWQGWPCCTWVGGTGASFPFSDREALADSVAGSSVVPGPRDLLRSRRTAVHCRRIGGRCVADQCGDETRRSGGRRCGAGGSGSSRCIGPYGVDRALDAVGALRGTRPAVLRALVPRTLGWGAAVTSPPRSPVLVVAGFEVLSVLVKGPDQRASYRPGTPGRCSRGPPIAVPTRHRSTLQVSWLAAGIGGKRPGPARPGNCSSRLSATRPAVRRSPGRSRAAGSARCPRRCRRCASAVRRVPIAAIGAIAFAESGSVRPFPSSTSTGVVLGRRIAGGHSGHGPGAPGEPDERGNGGSAALTRAPTSGLVRPSRLRDYGCLAEPCVRRHNPTVGGEVGGICERVWPAEVVAHGDCAGGVRGTNDRDDSG